MLSMDTRKMAAMGAAGFIASALIIAAATPVRAQPPLGQQRPVTVTAHKDSLKRVVSYRDLSLATKDGRRILMHRVRGAVNEVCPDQDDDGFIRDGRDVDYCKDFAWAGARPQIRRAFDRALANPTLAMSITISTATVK